MFFGRRNLLMGKISKNGKHKNWKKRWLKIVQKDFDWD